MPLSDKKDKKEKEKERKRRDSNSSRSSVGSSSSITSKTSKSSKTSKNDKSLSRTESCSSNMCEDSISRKSTSSARYSSHRSSTSSISSGVSRMSFVLPEEKKHRKFQILAQKMLAEGTGLELEDISTFSKVFYSVARGHSLITWICTNMNIDNRELGKLLANRMFIAGFIFPLEYSAIKDTADCYIRIQLPFYWNNTKPTEYDHAVFLVKQQMLYAKMTSEQEKEFARLKTVLIDRWDFLCSQANEQISFAGKSKTSKEIAIFTSQEVAYFWKHYPPAQKKKVDKEIAELEEVVLDHRALQAQIWGRSLNDLLNFGGTELFMDYLGGEYSNENLKFWVAVEKFRQNTDISKNEEMAKGIISKFLMNSSAQEINLSASVSMKISAENDEGSYHKNMFTSAQNEVYELMNKDSYHRFVRSPVYTKRKSEAIAIRYAWGNV